MPLLNRKDFDHNMKYKNIRPRQNHFPSCYGKYDGSYDRSAKADTKADGSHNRSNKTNRKYDRGDKAI